jgi:hypothetical protein
MATSKLTSTQLLFTSDGTTANARMTATPDVLTLFGAGNVPNEVTLRNLKNPSEAQDAATKSYVDGLVVSGVTWKNAANVATTASDMTNSTYSNAGLGTITWVGVPTIDGVTMVVGYRVVVQNNAATNGTNSQGIYEVTSITTNLVLARATDAAAGDQANGAAIFVFSGSVNNDKAFVVTNNTPVDWDAGVTWSIMSSVPAVAGANTQVQYNDNGSLGASSAFTYVNNSGTTPVLTVDGSTSSTFNNGDIALLSNGADTITSSGTSLIVGSGSGNATFRSTNGSATLSGSTTASVTASGGAATITGSSGASITATAGAASMTATAGAASMTASGGAATVSGSTTASLTAGSGAASVSSTSDAVSITGQTGVTVTATAGNATLTGSGPTVVESTGDDVILDAATAGKIDFQINSASVGEVSGNDLYMTTSGAELGVSVGGDSMYLTVVAAVPTLAFNNGTLLTVKQTGGTELTLNSGGTAATITNVATPVAGTDAVNKNYVDGGAHSVAGSNTQVQYNDGGSFGASSAFTFNIDPSISVVTVDGTTSGSLVLNGDTGSLTFLSNATTNSIVSSANNDFTLSATGAGPVLSLLSTGTAAITIDNGLNITSNTANIVVDGQTGITLEANGGDMIVNGGDMTFTCKNGPNAGNGDNGGVITMTSGNGNDAGAGGALDFNAGSGGATGAGGAITINAGAGGTTSGLGGNLVLQAGSATTVAQAGNLVLKIAQNDTSTSTNNIIQFQAGNGSAIGRIENNGAMYATEFNATSDVRYKENINRLSDPLDTIKKIEGYSYNWKKDFSGYRNVLQYGVLAQQLETAGLKNLVSGTEESKAVNYIGLIPLLIEAVKELSSQLEKVQREQAN